MTTTAHRKCNDLRRHLKLERPSGRSVRLHHWVVGDPPEYQHAHPWPFITIVLWGGYDDIADGRPTDVVRAPTIRFRDTSWRHAVTNPLPRTWSIVITGPYLSKWRFWMWNREVDRDEWNGRVCD